MPDALVAWLCISVLGLVLTVIVLLGGVGIKRLTPLGFGSLLLLCIVFLPGVIVGLILILILGSGDWLWPRVKPWLIKSEGSSGSG